MESNEKMRRLTELREKARIEENSIKSSAREDGIEIDKEERKQTKTEKKTVLGWHIMESM